MGCIDFHTHTFGIYSVTKNKENEYLVIRHTVNHPVHAHIECSRDDLPVRGWEEKGVCLVLGKVKVRHDVH